MLAARSPQTQCCLEHQVDTLEGFESGERQRSISAAGTQSDCEQPTEIYNPLRLGVDLALPNETDDEELRLTVKE